MLVDLWSTKLGLMLRKNTPERNIKMDPLEDAGKVTGFSSPATDYSQDRLHIIQKLVKDPTNTFYFEMENNDMSGFGILKGALLVVDRSVKPKNEEIVIANVEGVWITRKLLIQTNSVSLASSLEKETNIDITDNAVIIFGTVIWSCNPMEVS